MSASVPGPSPRNLAWTSRSRMAVSALLAVIAIGAVIALPGESRASGCTITWVGDVDGNWFGGSSGTNTNWNDDTFPDATDHACLNTLGGPYTVTLSTAALVDHYTIESGASLAVVGVAFRSESDSTSAGTISLSGSGAALRTENGVVGDVETLTNTGTISMLAGAAGNRFISGDLLNQGTILVDHVQPSFEASAEARPPKLTNSGTVTVTTGSALRFNNSTFAQATGGTVNGPGAVNVINSTGRLEISGGAIAADGDVNMGNATTLAFVAPGATTGEVDITGGETRLSGDVPAGFTIDVDGVAQLRSFSDVTNAGTIRLSASGAELRTENGVPGDVETLTNTGTISMPAGVAGSRFISGDLLNQGTILVDHLQPSVEQRTEARPPKLTNMGTVTVTTGSALRFNNSTFAQATGGTVNGPGAVNVINGTGRLEISGGAIAANGDVNMGGSTTLAFVAPGAATGEVDITGGETRLSGDVPAGFTIDVDGVAQLRSFSDVTNAGTIRLSASNAQLRTENGVAGDVETLTNTGTISIPAGGAGSRLISGDLLNQGTILVDHLQPSFEASAEARPPKLTNTGTVTVTTGSALRFNNSTFAQAAGGTVNGAGELNVINGTGRLEISGGAIAASADVNMGGSTTLAFVAAGAATGNVDITGGETRLSGDVPTGITIDVDGVAQLRSYSDVTNAGTIRLITSNAQLRTENGVPGDVETLTNTGTISIPTGGAGSRLISGDLLNQGTILVDHPQATFEASAESRPPKLTNSGTVTVSSGTLLRFNNSTFAQSTGGTVNGAGELNVINGTGRMEISGGAIAAGVDVNLGNATTLAFVAATVATGNVDITGSSVVTGNVPAGITLDLNEPNAHLNAAASYSNAGTINLVTSGTQLVTTGGGTLTNTGTITSGTTAGTRSVIGGFVNAGTVKPGGDGIGTLNADSYTQTAAGRLELRVAGAASADRLAVSGAIDLDGRLALSRTGPALTLGQTFDVVTQGSRTGTFSALSGASTGPFAVTYPAGSVRLTVVAAGVNPEVSVGDAAIVEGESGTSAISVPVTLDRVTDVPVEVTATTRNVLASAPGDFVARTATVTVPEGSTSASFDVTVNGEQVAENDETFKIDLSNPVGADLGRDAATATIRTDDPALESVAPGRAGAGPVTFTLGGLGLVPGSSVRLRRAGQADIDGTTVTTAAGTQVLQASFDLTGRPHGAWDVDVTLPDGRGTATLAGGVEIEAAGAAAPWVDLSGPAVARVGRPAAVQLLYGNSGNVDALGVRISVTGIPAGSLAPTDLIGKGGYVSSRSGNEMELYFSRLPAGASGALRFDYTETANTATTVTATLRESVVEPNAIPAPDPTIQRPGTVDELSGARYRGRVNAIRGGNDEGALSFSLRTVEAPESGSEFSFTDRSTGDLSAFTAHANFTTTLLDGVPSPARKKTFSLEFDADSSQKVLDYAKQGRDALDKGNDLIADYSIELDQKTINECLFRLGRLTPEQKLTLDNLASAAFTIKLANAAVGDLAGDYYGQHIKVFTEVTSGAWEAALVGSKGFVFSSTGYIDISNDPNDPFLGEFGPASDKEQLAKIISFCLSRPDLVPGRAAQPRFKAPPGATRTTTWRASRDPNEKVGPEGDGSAEHHVTPDQPLRYRILFENKDDATAPAAEVVVTDQLDPAEVDLDTFALGPIIFGNRLVTPPAGVQTYSTTVDLAPAKPILVRIDAALNRTNNVVTWRLEAIDPATGEQPIDPDLGFLPPNTSPPAGEGSVGFTVAPKAGLATGTAIENAASIVFDTNAPIVTGTWRNTIDRDAPAAAAREAAPIAGANCATDLKVSWSGSDPGSGIRTYDVYSVDDAGVLSLLLPRTTRTETSFRGRAGTTYRFAVRAVDGAGNVQALPAAAQVQGAASCPAAVGGATPTPTPSPIGDLRAPTVSLSLTNKRFRLNRAPKRRPKLPVGTTFRVTLSEPASFTIKLEKLSRGVRVGKKCLSPSKRRRGKKCTLAKPAGTITRRNAKSGRTSVKFNGRVGRKSLAAASYRATVIATDAAGNRSKPKTVSFTVVR